LANFKLSLFSSYFLKMFIWRLEFFLAKHFPAGQLGNTGDSAEAVPARDGLSAENGIRTCTQSLLASVNVTQRLGEIHDSEPLRRLFANRLEVCGSSDIEGLGCPRLVGEKLSRWVIPLPKRFSCVTHTPIEHLCDIGAFVPHHSWTWTPGFAFNPLPEDFTTYSRHWHWWPDSSLWQRFYTLKQRSSALSHIWLHCKRMWQRIIHRFFPWQNPLLNFKFLHSRRSRSALAHRSDIWAIFNLMLLVALVTNFSFPKQLRWTLTPVHPSGASSSNSLIQVLVVVIVHNVLAFISCHLVDAFMHRRLLLSSERWALFRNKGFAFDVVLVLVCQEMIFLFYSDSAILSRHLRPLSIEHALSSICGDLCAISRTFASLGGAGTSWFKSILSYGGRSPANFIFVEHWFWFP
jgi:hypothetical protein